jgi:hypothetical protein
VLKAVAPGWVSLSVFALTQVLIDLEPLYFLLAGEWHVHRWVHTYLGVTGVVALSAWLSPPVCRWTIWLWNHRVNREGQSRLKVSPHIPRRAAFVGAVIGGYSHVFLDSLMHADMTPWAPFATTNGLFFTLSYDHLHLLCAGLGLVGLSMLALRGARSCRGRADPG